MQKVETGIADNTYIEIKSGLKPGDEVVSGSYTAISRKLKDGARVAIEKQGKGWDREFRARPGFLTQDSGLSTRHGQTAEAVRFHRRSPPRDH